MLQLDVSYVRRHLLRYAWFSCVLLLLACGTPRPTPLPLARTITKCQQPPAYYQVRRGDTLSHIATAYCLKIGDLVRWNKIADPDLITVNQRLRLTAASAASDPAEPRRRASQTNVATARPASNPSSTRVNAPRPAPKPTAPSIARNQWLWPAQGRVVSGFAPDQPGRNGIRIQGRPGQRIRATLAGQIVYTGNSLPGYGRLIIVDHDNGLLSAYGYLGKLYVREGDSVDRGEIIAELGSSGHNGKRPALHFEIRKDGQPVNPLQYLPG